MTGGREERSIQFNWNDHIQSNYYKSERAGSTIQQFEITHNEGIFRQFSKVPSDREVPIESREIGGMEGIPVPAVVDDFHLMQKLKEDTDSGRLDRKFIIASNDSMFSFYCANIASLLRINEAIDKMTPRGQKIYQYVLNNQFEEAFTYYRNASEKVNAMEVLTLLKQYTGVPQAKLNEFLKEVIKLCKKTIVAGENGWVMQDCKKILNDIAQYSKSLVASAAESKEALNELGGILLTGPTGVKLSAGIAGAKAYVENLNGDKVYEGDFITLDTLVPSWIPRNKELEIKEIRLDGTVAFKNGICQNVSGIKDFTKVNSGALDNSGSPTVAMNSFN